MFHIGQMEWWNIGVLILKGVYSFVNLPAKRCFNNNPLPHFPEPIIPVFQYSNCERSELSSGFPQLFKITKGSTSGAK